MPHAYTLFFWTCLVIGASLWIVTEHRALHKSGRVPDLIDTAFALCVGAMLGALVAVVITAAHRYVTS